MSMTVKAVFQRALAHIFESPGGDADFDNYSPHILDNLILQCLPYENAVRSAQGRDTLQSAPLIEAIDETALDFDDRITRIALPYGLASALLMDDESRKTDSVLFWNKFVDALENLAPYTFEDIAIPWE